MCCSFRRNIDAMMSKFLSKNKCNYLQHHFIYNYKFSVSNKNNGMPGKITVKQSGNCVIGLSHVKLGWKSCIFCSLTPLIAANAAILLAPSPPVTAGRRASGKKNTRRKFIFANKICITLTPVAMVTKICDFQHIPMDVMT